MTLEEKYNKYKELFFKHFINTEYDPICAGSHIPVGSVSLSEICDSKTVGDGTINMAEYMQYLFWAIYSNEDVELNERRLKNCIKSLSRLSDRAFQEAKKKYPNIPFKKEPGFFLRDDFDGSKVFERPCTIISSFDCYLFNDNEDPCHSPYISQDQAWNLANILVKISENDWLFTDPSIDELAHDAIYSIFEYIVRCNHKIYDPYNSRVFHYLKYVPTFNTEKVAPWNRKKDREANFKPKIKVKRGANNWYYAYGFRRVFKLLGGETSKWKSFWYGFIYYPIIFVADRIYFPFLERVFGKSRKDNSFYCLGTAGNVWYGTRKQFLKRICKRFSKNIDSYWNTCLLECEDQNNYDYIDFKQIETYLNSYPEPSENSTINSPIKFMILYLFIKNFPD